MSRWVKLSLNFELLVNRVMKLLLGHRLFNNNIFSYNLNYSASKKQPCYRINKINKYRINKIKLKLNKIKDKFNGIPVINFHNRSTEPLNIIIESIHGLNQAIKQDDQSFITTRDPLGQIKSKF